MFHWRKDGRDRDDDTSHFHWQCYHDRFMGMATMYINAFCDLKTTVSSNFKQGGNHVKARQLKEREFHNTNT